ncbi:interleukin 17a/f3 [Austrofundulus limnaeus]|uniref:Interleukin 17a/f3 n=1 Tax=Austrofundulus limnaeus TaxID=52670 RepID=A0A2I4CRX9_AUSLI|nr:PREDICTED: interleukin-17F-like [Austrofundulus limnaeus]
MRLVRRVFLLLGLVSLLDATKKTRGVSVQGPGLRGRTVRLILDTSVKSYNKAASNLADMSLSPWTYINSINASRFPKRISQAKCQTSGCVNLRGREEDLTLEAKPIKYQVLVLHRVPRQTSLKNGGKKAYDYVLGTEVVTVGCTCVRPSVVPQQ